MSTETVDLPYVNYQSSYSVFTSKISSLFVTAPLALDIGTANTLIYQRGKGIIAHEPTILARDQHKKLVNYGTSARSRLGRAPRDITFSRPLRHGVIQDAEGLALMLRQMLKGAQISSRIVGPRTVVTTPSLLSSPEQKLLLEILADLNLRDVTLVPEAHAAARGSEGATAHGVTILVNIGGGTTELASFIQGRQVAIQSHKLGGDDIDHAVQLLLRHHFNLEIGEVQAEEIKKSIATARFSTKECCIKVSGRDIISSLPRAVQLCSEDILPAVMPSLQATEKFIRQIAEKTETHLDSSTLPCSIVLAGGGSLLRGLDGWLRERVGVPVTTTRDPFTTVIRGAAQMLARRGQPIQ